MTGRQVFKHDLALALGMTLAQIDGMTEREFLRWDLYAAHKQLPQRRLEIGLAMIARNLVGGSIDDFLLSDGSPPKQDTPEIVATALGGGAFKLGQKRKKKG